MAEHWVMKKCPICGKEFLPAAQHSWKIGTEFRPVLVCSYTCQRKWEKTPKAKKTVYAKREKAAIRIVETGETFGTVAEVAEHLDAGLSTIYRCVQKGKPYAGLHIERIKK